MKTRYRNLAEDYQQVFREQVVFGCHVHVGIDDREAAIQTMNRTRPWLPVLLALSANSPFWLGADTGHASFRTEIWNRWPMAGMPQAFASRAEYDVCMLVDEAVMVAGLARALAVTCHAAAVRGDPEPQPRPELLRAAKWRAARHGLGAELVDVLAGRAVPAPEMVGVFLAEIRPGLEAGGDLDEVTELVRATLARGTGAARQREGRSSGPEAWVRWWTWWSRKPPCRPCLAGSPWLWWPRAFDGGAQGSPANRAERPTARSATLRT